MEEGFGIGGEDAEVALSGEGEVLQAFKLEVGDVVLLMRLPGKAGGADGEVPGALLAGVERAQAVLRDLVTGIHPAALTAGGLSDALPGLAELCPVPVSLDVPPRRFPAGVEAAVYFVCSEALANIARHAGATTAALRVWERDGRLYLEVTDDGAGGAVIGDGIQAGGSAGGSGLRGLADRMAALGGTLAVHSPPGSGTRVMAELPLTYPPVPGP